MTASCAGQQSSKAERGTSVKHKDRVNQHKLVVFSEKKEKMYQTLTLCWSRKTETAIQSALILFSNYISWIRPASLLLFL